MLSKTRTMKSRTTCCQYMVPVVGVQQRTWRRGVGRRRLLDLSSDSRPKPVGNHWTLRRRLVGEVWACSGLGVRVQSGGGCRCFIWGALWVLGDGLGQTKAWVWLWPRPTERAGTRGHGADGVCGSPRLPGSRGGWAVGVDYTLVSDYTAACVTKTWMRRRATHAAAKRRTSRAICDWPEQRFDRFDPHHNRPARGFQSAVTTESKMTSSLAFLVREGRQTAEC